MKKLSTLLSQSLPGSVRIRRLRTQSLAISGAVLVLLSIVSACAQNSKWRDPSKHKVLFVTVDSDVKLEVLDWGGSGRPIVLLAGSGCTAHIYDNFAEELAGPFHVYGVTRRGFGASSHPDSGYAQQRLADDVLHVLDSLQLVKPVLVGHSMAGGEMTTLASEHPDRVEALVFLDAARDPTRDYAPLRERAAAAGVAQPTPSGQDFHSFQSYREWQTKALGYAFPESELRNGFATNNDGSMGHFRTPPDVFRSVAEGTQKREYGSLTLPVLAIFAVPARPEEIVSLTYKPRDAREQSALDANYKSILKYIQVDEKSIYSAHNAQVIELKGADHYVFLTQSAAVIQDLRNFLAGLH